MQRVQIGAHRKIRLAIQVVKFVHHGVVRRQVMIHGQFLSFAILKVRQIMVAVVRERRIRINVRVAKRVPHQVVRIRVRL